MACSKLGYQKWLLGMYLLRKSKKGISSLALADHLEISPKSAWHLSHRLRAALEVEQGELMTGTLEIDETYVGGLEKNRHLSERGKHPKMPVVGVKERESNKVKAVVMPYVNRNSIRDWLYTVVGTEATLYTDESPVYKGVAVEVHECVNHKRKEYVRGDCHTNGIESFWSLLKKGYKGTHIFWSHKHMHRYVCEFTERFNLRELDTIDALKIIAARMTGRRLRFSELTA